MPIEIEAKMRLEDVASVEAALRHAGASRDIELHEINTFFDTPDGSLKTSDRGLRIRVEQQVDGPHYMVLITHKGPRSHGKLKSRSETELAVDNAQAAAELLNALGYVPVMSFEKRRARWRLDDCIIAIDQVPFLGSFIEIEGESEQSVLAVRDRLDMGQVPLIRSSYIAMLRTHLTDHNLHMDHVGFDVEAAGQSQS